MSISVEIKRILKEKDYYEILKLERTATESEVTTAFKKLAMKVHPDKCPGIEGAAEAFKKIGKVKEVLLNDNSRAAYDRYGEEGAQHTGVSASGFSQEDIFREMFMGSMGGMGGEGVRFNMNGTHFTFQSGNPFGRRPQQNHHHHQQQQQQQQQRNSTNPLNIIAMVMMFVTFLLPLLFRLFSNLLPLIIFSAIIMVVPSQYRVCFFFFFFFFLHRRKSDCASQYNCLGYNKSIKRLFFYLNGN